MLVNATIYKEPFFDAAVKNLRNDILQPLEHETDVDILTTLSRNGSDFKPAGFIIHVTRCGSTLVLNALKQAEGVCATGEAQPFEMGLHLAGLPSPHWSMVGREILISGARLFANNTLIDAGVFLIKWGVNGMMGLQTLRAIWPDVPCLILIRNPLEVVVSNVQRPAQWLVQVCALRQAGLTAPRWEAVDNLVAVEPGRFKANDLVSTCAWILGRGFEHLHANLDPFCMVVDYDDLSPAVVSAVAERFGLRFSAAAGTRLERSFEDNAKTPNRPFTPDSIRKRGAATPAMHTAVQQWAEGPYRKLRARCSTCTG